MNQEQIEKYKEFLTRQSGNPISYIGPSTAGMKPVSSLPNNQTAGSAFNNWGNRIVEYFGAPYEAVKMGLMGLNKDPTKLANYQPKYITPEKYGTPMDILRTQAKNTLAVGSLATAVMSPVTALQGAALSTGGQAYQNVKQGRGLLEGLDSAAVRGVENSAILAVTNVATDKILGSIAKNVGPQLSKKLTGLVGSNVQAPFKYSKTALDSVMKNKAFKMGVERVIARALSEVPMESIAFGTKNAAENKENLIKSIINDIPGNIMGNLLFAGLNVGAKGADVYLGSSATELKRIIDNNIRRFKNNERGAIVPGAKIGGEDIKPQGLELPKGSIVSSDGTRYTYKGRSYPLLTGNEKSSIKLTPEELKTANPDIWNQANKVPTIKIKSPETKIAELEQKLKNEPDWGKKGKLRAEIEKLRAEIDPTIKARQEEFDKSMELTKQKNYETANIQKKLTPVNNRIIELNKEVPIALSKSKGSKKGDDSWVKANELVKEKAKLMQEQKELLSQRDGIKVKQPEAKLEPTKVEEPKAVVPVGDIKLPKNEIVTSVQKTSSPINKDVNTKIQPLLENIQKIMKDKGLVEKDVVNLRRTGTLEDKELTKVFDNLAEELHSMWKKYAGVDIPFRKSYIPDPSTGSSDKIRALVTGGNFIDDVSGIYSPTMRRISGDMELHKTGDLLNAYKANIDSLKYQANKTEIDALLNNLSVKSQQVLAEASKKLGEQIRDTGRGDLDVIKMAKEIAENENIKGPEIVVKRISGFKQKVYDIYNGFDRIGIREPLMNLINYEQNGRALATSLDNSVKNGDIDSVLKEVYKRYPTFDVNSAKDIFTNIQTRTGSIEEPTATLINGLAKKDGIATLLDVLPRLKFEDTDTQKYVNDSLAFILGSDAKTKNVATLFQAKLRKWTTRGMLGLNFSPAIQNITEVRRLFGTSNPKYLAEGIANSGKQMSGMEVSALKKYGFDEDGRYQEKFLETEQGKILNKSLSGKADDLLNNVMIMFKASESLKDNVYLNAFEAEGKSKGLKGKDLSDYVIHKFRKYSIHGDEWGTLGMFNKGLFGLKGETVKTILQFNQYSMRELGILMDKFTDIKGEPLQALQYITSYALTGLVLYQIYEAMGLNGKNAAISLPLGLSNTLDRDKNDFYKKTPVDEILQAFRNISPNTSLVTDLGMFAYEYFANNEEGEDRVAPYLEQRVVKDLFGRFPAGGQIMKTYGVPFMGNQYGGYLQNLKAGYQPNTTGNMRFPVTSETPWEAIKGATFGSASTKYGKEFWKDYKEGMAPATKDFQLDKYKELVSQGKREEAVEYWKKGYENKQRYYTSKNEEYNRLNVQQKAAFDSLPESNPDTPIDDIHKYVTLMQYPEIYNAKKSIAYAVAEGDESLVDPFYTVDYATAKNYMLYKSQPPKSEEAKRIKEAHPEVIALAAARSQFYKDHPIEGQEDTGYDAPIASDYVQKQMDAKNWKDPQVKAFLTAYSDWQNDQREAMGLDRIEYGGGSGYDPMKYFNPTANKVKISIPKAKKISIKSSTPKKIKSRSLTPRKIAVTPVTDLKKKIKIPKANPKVKLRA